MIGGDIVHSPVSVADTMGTPLEGESQESQEQESVAFSSESSLESSMEIQSIVEGKKVGKEGTQAHGQQCHCPVWT